MTTASPTAVVTLLIQTVALMFANQAAAQAPYRSHPPMRSLPVPSAREQPPGPTFVVDPARGNDSHDGTVQKPWQTLNHALSKLQAGDTLVMRGGTYYEAVRLRCSGTADKPITIRAHSGELAVLDAGWREFLESPATSWEPAPSGVAGEFRSTKSYPTGGGFGNFGDSLVPFHRYMNFYDLRSSNELYRPELSDRKEDPRGMYVGPGVLRDPATGRIHIRLSHTQLAGLGRHHYRGETDPRKLPLVIAGHDYALQIEGAKHVRIQDLVVRGAQRSAVAIADSEDIALEGVTLYGSGSALRVSRTQRLRLSHSALRGHAAPWHSRFHHKNRAGSGYLLTAEGRDFEFAHCEFTDHHDALQLHGVEGLRFHHNLVDNFNDDGIELGPKKERGEYLIYQNFISRCLNPFTLHGKKPTTVMAEPGSGAYVCRNIIDLRQGIYKTPPTEPDPTGSYLNELIEIIAHEHGSPTLPVYYVYHNTFLMQRGGWRGYYAFTWGAHTHGTTRRVFNNIFLQVEGIPGQNFSAIGAEDDFAADGNLLWGVREGPMFTGDLFGKFRRSAEFLASQKRYAPGWGARDVFADPRFVSDLKDSQAPTDVRLSKDSPAIDAGITIPTDWPDPLRQQDRGQPDIGALPLDAPLFQVGPAAKPSRNS